MPSSSSSETSYSPSGAVRTRTPHTCFAADGVVLGGEPGLLDGALVACPVALRGKDLAADLDLEAAGLLLHDALAVLPDVHHGVEDVAAKFGPRAATLVPAPLAGVVVLQPDARALHERGLDRGLLLAGGAEFILGAELREPSPDLERELALQAVALRQVLRPPRKHHVGVLGVLADAGELVRLVAVDAAQAAPVTGTRPRLLARILVLL